MSIETRAQCTKTLPDVARARRAGPWKALKLVETMSTTRRKFDADENFVQTILE